MEPDSLISVKISLEKIGTFGNHRIILLLTLTMPVAAMLFQRRTLTYGLLQNQLFDGLGKNIQILLLEKCLSLLG